jgi:PKD repeat protein
MSAQIKPIPLQVTPYSETDYIAMVTIPWEEGMNADYSDLSFVDSDKVTALKQYMEDFRPGYEALSYRIFWIKVPVKPAAGKTVYLLFGDPTAVLRREPNDVFLFWDTGRNGDGTEDDASILMPFFQAGPGDPAYWDNDLQIGRDADNCKWTKEFYWGSEPDEGEQWVPKIWKETIADWRAIHLKGYAYAIPYHSSIKSNVAIPAKHGVKFIFQDQDPASALNWSIVGLGSPDEDHYHYRRNNGTAGYYSCIGNHGTTAPTIMSYQDLTIHRYSDSQVKYFKNEVLDWDNSSGGVCAEDVAIWIETRDGDLYMFGILAYKLPADADLDQPTPGTTEPVFELNPTVDTPTGDKPLVVHFEPGVTGEDPDTYLWDFGDGSTSTEEDPDHTYETEGDYDVTLTVCKTIGGITYCETVTMTNAVVVTVREISGMNELLDDIAFRIRNPKGNRWEYYPHIQRTIQRLYWRLNKQYRLVKDELEMDFSTLGTFVAYWTLPRWYMKLYRLDPDFEWREPDEFDAAEANTYTITAGRIYFGGIDATEVVTMYFYSSGKKMVAKADGDLLTDECNTPEWTDRSLDQALYYGACVELKQDYPGFQHDVNEYNELKKRMFDSFDADQDKDLVLPGDPAPGTPDAYGWVD